MHLGIEKKIKIHFINDNIILDPFNNYTEYSKKWNKLLLSLVLSSIESDTKSDKQIASIKYRRKKYKGQYEFGRVPFGKKIVRTKDGNRIFKTFNKVSMSSTPASGEAKSWAPIACAPKFAKCACPSIKPGTKV